MKNVQPKRAVWIGTAVTACVVILAAGTAARAGELALSAERVVEGREKSVFITFAPGDHERLFIVQRAGAVWILDLNTSSLMPEPFIEVEALAEAEMGLLGMAFHPDYDKNGYFYLDFNDKTWATNVVRYTVSEDPNIADPDSAVTLLTIDQPFRIHNAGWIGFGPNDGYLYIASGDGGSETNAQDVTDNLLGKMLRIDVDADDRGNYGIPPDNPFVGKEGDDEIWAYGLRNPYRCSFDRETGDLWIGDVGHHTREEINFQPACSTGGENYGWPCMEGTWCTGSEECTCNDDALTDPIYEFTHEDGRQASMGGYVYRGCDIPALYGTYLFGDWAASVWTLVYDGQDVRDFTDWTAEVWPRPANISSFGEDAAGELYICHWSRGDVYRIIAAEPTADINCDRVVDFADLLLVLGAWGPCDDCPEDVDGDGQVGFDDLLAVLDNWSP